MAELTRDAMQVLLEMRMLMFGKTSSLNAATKGGENPSPIPQGEANPPADHWARIFLSCAEHDLDDLVRAARDELQAILRRDPASMVQTPDEPRAAWEARIIEEGEGYEARHVATSFRTSVAEVTRIRKREKRDPNLGYHLHRLPGETVRQMAARTGMSKSAVGRLVSS